MGSLSLSVVEIIVLMLGAIVLGITIHFFIVSRRNLKASISSTSQKSSQGLNEWKLKYFNEVEIRDKELVTLRQQLSQSEESRNIFSIEADEMKRQNKKLLAELESIKKSVPGLTQGEKPDYLEQLREAQASLIEHNEKVSQLLSNIDMIKETEEKQKEILKENEELAVKIEELEYKLMQKEKEVSTIRQKAFLSQEMSSMLDNAYTEFSSLQDKMQKLESQVSSSKKINIDYEDMKEEYYKLRRDFEEQRLKLNAFSSENKDIQSRLMETEDKLKEANFQRQQLQKRVGYLEELNNDLQEVSDANKRLEGQIRRIGELESMLNVVSEERDQLMRRQL